jgi:hypothetical protein
LQQLEAGPRSTRCAGDASAQCLADVEQWVNALDKGGSALAEPVLLRARLLQVQGDADGAAALLGTRCPDLTGRERAVCMKARLGLAVRTKSGAHLATAAKDYVAENCLDADSCSAALTKIGDAYVAKSDWDSALSFYDRAARERADDTLWMKVAHAAVHAGAFQRAQSALDRVHDKAQFEPEYSKLVKAAHAGQLSGALRLDAPPGPSR